MDDAGSMAVWQYAQIRAAGGTLWWTGVGDDRRLDGFDPIEHLNVAGKDGWELVGLTEAAVDHTLVTKFVLKGEVETG